MTTDQAENEEVVVPFPAATPDSANRLASAIRRARETKGWSQRNLAEFVGLDRETVRRIEAGQADPRWTDAVRLLITLGIITHDNLVPLGKIIFGQKTTAKETP
jgi:ribosome-binding protein aMBF1 (putative translation factor)